MTEASPAHVEPGGDALVIELSPTITLTKFSVGPMDNNCYLLDDGSAQVLIDAANDWPRIDEVVDTDRLTTIVTTHRHADHVAALADSLAGTGAQPVCGTKDVDAINSATGTRQKPIWDGDNVSFPNGEHLKVISLVGHTPGSIALAYQPKEGPAHLFTGDSLFPGGPGKTDGAANFTRLMDDLEKKIFGAFPDGTVVHPGHGDGTTLGAERPHLTEWRERGW